MSSLLDIAIAAHGGLERWNALSQLRSDVSLSGVLWGSRNEPDVLEKTSLSARLHQQRLDLGPFSNARVQTSFAPGRVEARYPDGRSLLRNHPRQRMLDPDAGPAWDDIDVAYFASYALWAYITIPFLYVTSGFSSEEIEPWEEGGEVWRRLKVQFPERIDTHCKEQVSYFGPDGLLRRHDYTVEVLGGVWGANYASQYRTVGGIAVPTRREVFAIGPDNHKVPEPLLVGIDFGEMVFL
jgi:hypothetical protein